MVISSYKYVNFPFISSYSKITILRVFLKKQKNKLANIMYHINNKKKNILNINICSHGI